MTVNEIYTAINQKYPKKCKSIDSLRSRLQGKEFVYYRGSGQQVWIINLGKSKGLKPGSIKIYVSSSSKKKMNQFMHLNYSLM